jgi:hypothetical protein
MIQVSKPSAKSTPPVKSVKKRKEQDLLQKRL